MEGEGRELMMLECARKCTRVSFLPVVKSSHINQSQDRDRDAKTLKHAHPHTHTHLHTSTYPELHLLHRCQGRLDVLKLHKSIRRAVFPWRGHYPHCVCHDRGEKKEEEEGWVE